MVSEIPFLCTFYSCNIKPIIAAQYFLLKLHHLLSSVYMVKLRLKQLKEKG